MGDHQPSFWGLKPIFQLSPKPLVESNRPDDSLGSLRVQVPPPGGFWLVFCGQNLARPGDPLPEARRLGLHAAEPAAGEGGRGREGMGCQEKTTGGFGVRGWMEGKRGRSGAMKTMGCGGEGACVVGPVLISLSSACWGLFVWKS